MKRRLSTVATLAVAFLTASVAPLASADSTYPSKPIRVVIPMPPGGSSAILARIVCDKMAETLGQPLVIDSKPGAGGNIASALVTRAQPDGYTLLWATAGTHGINPIIYKNPGYDPVKDFSPIGLAVSSPNVIVVNAAFPAKTLKELIDLAKANPGKYDSAAGNTSTPHLMGEYFKAKAGIQVPYVPYQGSGPALVDTIAGHIPIMFDGLPSALPHIKSGKLRGLGVSSEKRSAMAPDIPTIGETIPGFSTVAWWALLAPAGTPAPVVEKLNKALNLALESLDVQKRLSELGATAEGGTPAKLADQIQQELARWTDVVKVSPVKVE